MFYGGIIFYTFPNCSFVNGNSITRSIPVVVNREGALQYGMDWETGCSGYDAIIFQYSFCVNNNSIFPQMSSEYGRGWGNFIEIGDRAVYYSLSMGP